METALDLFCPACGVGLILRLGCQGGCIQRAVHLQLRRFGTELVCHACGQRHVVRATDIPGERLWSVAPRSDGDDQLFDGLMSMNDVPGNNSSPAVTGDSPD